MRRTEQENTQSSGLRFGQSNSESVPGRPKRKLKKRSRKPLIIGVCLVMLIVAGSLLYITRPRSPIPSTISHAVSFPLYYPAELPEGYSFDKSSFKAQDNIVTYSVKNKSQSTVITQQASPNQSFNFQNTPGGFREVPSSIGQANIGAVGSTPVAIVSTEKTLVSLRGSAGMDSETMTKLVESLTTGPD